MRFKDLVQRGKRPWPLGLHGTDATSRTIEEESHCRATIDSQSQRDDARSLSGMHTANTDGESQELSEEGLANLLSDTENQKYHESLEEAVQPCRWENLWAEAYRTIKNDPEYSHLLETFENYLRKAEHDAAEESLADASTVSEGVERLEEIQKLARTKLEKLPEARVAFSIGGRRVVVRELVQRSIRTVIAFKSIISEAVSAEPHAALAWGAILTILPMLENLYQQDEHAANGLNNILFILVRYGQLQETVLSNEFEAPSQTKATRQLLSIIRSKLVSVYAQVYVYQIRFILQYGRSKWLRNVRNIVSADDWKQMWNDIESTGRLVDQGIQDRVGTRTSEVWKAVNEIKVRTEEIKDLQRSALETELLLSLPFAGNAPFDSAEVLGAEAPCLEGTQCRILSDIRDWAENPAGEVIFWLHGMAGTGKTSVALTVANALNQRTPFTKGTNAPATAFLGASFFFKQGDATRNSTKAFFPTLARCLADVFLDFKSLIASSINENLAIGTKAPPQQLEHLIARPLSSLDGQTFLPIRLVIVVDALDECIQRTEAEDLLNMLATLEDLHQVQLRLLITSRTEKHILGSFDKLPEVLHRSVPLDKIKPHAGEESTKDDITFYLSHTLAEIAKKHGVAKDWIDQANINKLSEKADGLFIYAATACRFLDADDFPDHEARQERLDQIYQDYPETDDSETDEWETNAPQQKVDEIYLKVLSFPDREKMPRKTRHRTYDGMRMTLGFLAVLFEPVATSSLETLLPTLPVSLTQLLKKLHAIVGVPLDEKSPLDLVHLSFRDFILSKKRSKQLKFRVDETEMHKEVFGRCLHIMSSKLCRDICGLVMPGKTASEVSHSQIEENIPQYLRYTCRYWVDHLSKLDNSRLSEVGLMDGGKVHAFLQECFLYWLEAMSLIKETPTAILVVNQLQTLVVNSEHPDLSALIYDAKRFILANRWIIDHAPLQIYASALVFSPKANKIRSLSQHHMPRWITQRPVVEQDWTSELSVLEGHTDSIISVAFSPTDNLVVSTSDDKTARLWDYITGTERFRFDERKRYLCAAFSPDGKSVALGSDDGLISVREIGTGNIIDWKVYDGSISHVAFSPKSNKILVSASVADTAVQIWNVDERRVIHNCSTPISISASAAEFTPDGRFLIVGGCSESTTMWNVDNGECVRTFDDFDTTYVDGVAIFRDGAKAALIRGKKFCLFDLSTGEQHFEASYYNHITSISLLPPDENFVLIRLSNGSIQLRDVKTWSIVRQFHISPKTTCFALSRDGELLVSGDYDHYVLRLWDMRSSAAENKASDRGYDQAYYLRFSSDDSFIISCTMEEDYPQILDVTDGRTKLLPIDHVRGMGSSPDGRYVVLELDGGICQLWDKSMTTQMLDSKPLRNIFFSPDSNCMALVSTDGGVRIVNSTTFQEMMTPETFNIVDVEFSPNGQIVALSTFDPETTEHIFELWNLPYRERVLLTTLENAQADISSGYVNFSPNFSPNGQVVAFRSGNSETGHKGSWKVLDLVTGKEKWVPGGGRLVFHPDSHLVSIEARDSDDHSADLYITTYETASLEAKQQLKLPGSVNEWCTFWSMTTPTAPTTGKLVTVSPSEDTQGRNQTVKLWDTTTGLEIGSYGIEGKIDHLTSFDDRYLVCKQGRLPVPFSLPDQDKTDSKEKREETQNCLFVGSQWVYQGLERILWLPPAYRSDVSALRGETLALAHESGAVRVVKFNLTETPVSTVQQHALHFS